MASATFFEQQHLARRNTRVMVILFVLATIGVILALDLVAAATYVLASDGPRGATLAQRYAEAAEAVRCGIEQHLWSEEHGRYLRTLGDPTVDVSLLGLAWPFVAVDPRAPRMRATAAAVERALGRPGGGIMRYEGDTYAGGNAWVLAALWLGLYRRQTGDPEGHARALEYTQRVATTLDLLPEQATDDGEPAWVVPLAWSHAMLVLALRPELEVVRAPGMAAHSPVRAAD